MKDGEPEVRSAAACNIAEFSAPLNPDVILTSILPQVCMLVNDPSQHVRGMNCTDKYITSIY